MEKSIRVIFESRENSDISPYWTFNIQSDFAKGDRNLSKKKFGIASYVISVF